MAGPNVNTKATSPTASGRYNTSGMRVLSTKDLAKVRRLGAKTKPFSVKASKSA